MGREGIEKEDVLRDQRIYNISATGLLTRFPIPRSPCRPNTTSPRHPARRP